MSHQVERRYCARNVVREVARTRRRNNRIRAETHRRLRAYFATRPCVDCGNDNPLVREFHHVGVKRAEIALLLAGADSWPRIEREIAQCIVLCANCHRIRTSRERRNWRCVRERSAPPYTSTRGRAPALPSTAWTDAGAGSMPACSGCRDLPAPPRVRTWRPRGGAYTFRVLRNMHRGVA